MPHIFWKFSVIFYRQRTTWTWRLVLFIWNAVPNVDVPGSASVGGLAATAIVWYYFNYYTVCLPWQIKLYFTVNQKQIEGYLKITQIF